MPGSIHIPDEEKITVGDLYEVNSKTDEIKLGKLATHKVGFFGKAPVVQQAANPDTSAATLAALETEVNEIKAALRALGIIAT